MRIATSNGVMAKSRHSADRARGRGELENGMTCFARREARWSTYPILLLLVIFLGACSDQRQAAAPARSNESPSSSASVDPAFAGEWQGLYEAAKAEGRLDAFV